MLDLMGGYLLDPSQQLMMASSSGCRKKARDWRVLESPAGGSNTLCSYRLKRLIVSTYFRNDNMLKFINR